MCGIVGIAGDLFYKEEKTMQCLLLLDYFRGMDSTGLAAVRNTGEVKIAKLAADPITLFQMAKFKEALNGNNSKLFLGHNRASTSGSTNNYNSHPYQFDHITGVQNGTLETRDKIAMEAILGEKFEVDSQALFACIAKIGIKDTINMLHESTDSSRGAWALVWFDANENTINFLRNKHRPMWLGWDEGFKRLFFASQWQTLSHGCEFLGAYKFEKYERHDKPGEHYRFFNLPENQHIKLNLADMAKGSKTRPKPVAKELKGKESITSTSGSVSNLWQPPFPKKDGVKAGFHEPTRSSTIQSHLGCNRQGDRILHLFGTLEEPYANVLSLSRFAALVQVNKDDKQLGCSWCYADIPFGTGGITVYDQQDVILCDKCGGYSGSSEAPAARIFLSQKGFDTLKKAA